MVNISEQKEDNKEQKIEKFHKTDEFGVLRLKESKFLGSFTFDMYRGLLWFQRLWKGSLVSIFKMMKLDHE